MALCIIFDLDGTLADSLDILYNVYSNFVKRHGITPSQEEFSSINGVPIQKGISILSNRHNIVLNHQELYQEYMISIDENYKQVKPFEGAKEFIQQCYNSGLSMAIVTSGFTEHAQNWLNRVGFSSMFDFVIGCDQVKRGKPNPDPYLLALQQLKVPSNKALAIEDSYQGSLAALAAKIPTYMIKHRKNVEKTPDFIQGLVTSFSELEENLKNVLFSKNR